MLFDTKKDHIYTDFENVRAGDLSDEDFWHYGTKHGREVDEENARLLNTVKLDIYLEKEDWTRLGFKSAPTTAEAIAALNVAIDYYYAVNKINSIPN